MQMPTTAQLTAKQTRFVAEFGLDGNGAAAAVRAGYSPNGAKVTASRMLTNANPVRRAVEARQAADATRLGIARQNVLQGLLEAVEAARALGDPAAMIAGLREVARLLGFYPAPGAKAAAPVTADQGYMDRMNRLSDAELRQIIEGGAAPLP